MARKKQNSRKGILKAVGDVLMEGSKRYPYAQTVASDLFGMTPDDYRLDGWQECAPYTTKTTLQHLKSTLEENMRKCNVEDVIGVTYGMGYRRGVQDVIRLIDEMINQLNEEDNAEQVD